MSVRVLACCATRSPSRVPTDPRGQRRTNPNPSLRGHTRPQARSTPRARAKASARTAALEVVLSWAEGRSEHVADALSELQGGDAALTRELALGAVTHARLYDHLSDRFLRSGRQPEVLRWCLRLVAHQLYALDRIPPHAAVHETVEALRSVGQPKLVPVANAVARRLAVLRQEERTSDGPLGRLAAADLPTAPGVRHSLPDLLVEHLRPIAPTEDFDACLAALNVVPPLCTRTRPQHTGSLPGNGKLREEGSWTWWEDPAIALQLVGEGRCVVQDFAQGEVAELARARPGERVLDLCAAPGGKARALADAGAWVVASDLSPRKAGLLDRELRPLVMDGGMPAFADGSFDIVIVDAPCSNSGVLARRPEARWRYDDKHLLGLEQVQARLIRAGARLVAPGGRLVYSTCSLTPRENQGIAHRLPGWRILAERVTWPSAWHLGGYAVALVRI
jgi:16S rRNA (cytosine967-C5)-methyltransferase